MTIVDENGTERTVGAGVQADPTVQSNDRERLALFEAAIHKAAKNMWEAGALR